jgi:ketopantoate hydroxymethyltransferase
MTLQEQLLHVRTIRQEDVDVLHKVAAQDNHTVVAPNFILEKGGQMVGYIGMVPCVLMWLDSQRVKTRDSVTAMNFFENHLAVQGARVIALPCLPTSPLYRYIPQVGYLNCETQLFMKHLHQG